MYKDKDIYVSKQWVTQVPLRSSDHHGNKTHPLDLPYICI